MQNTIRFPAVLIIWALAAVAQADDFDLLTKQYKDYIFERGGARDAKNLAQSLQADGSWRDVNYQDKTRGGWQAYAHLTRVYSMVREYKNPQAASRKDAALGRAIHLALGYWLKNDFQNPNWWYNTIGVPMVTGDIAILMQDELTPDERAIMVNKIMPRGKIGMTGQNRVWVASITLVRGMLLKDRALVLEAARVIGEEIRVTKQEGIQPDFSFHQHGAQQQFGNYGLAFAHSAVSWLKVFSGTPFAYPKEKMDIVHDYLIQGEAWVVWKGRMDFSSCGRQLGRGTQASKGRSVADAMERMKTVDTARAKEYEAFLKRNQEGAVNDLIGNRNFWRSDYMIQRRPGFYASVKMCSRRVIGGEIVNSENMSGYHLADGAVFIYCAGAEYEDIQPVWDWRMIPGTTCAPRPGGPLRLTKSYHIDSDFVGGVSDGQIGCAALDYVRDGVKARKAWFFLDDAIACLGAGIVSDAAEPVVTTINQCWLKGDVLVCENGKSRKLERGDHRLPNIEWVWHDGVGYVFPNPSKVRISLGEQHGSWRKVEEKPHVSDADLKGPVFLLAIEHGVRPRSAGYAYLELPGVKPEAMPEKAKQPGIALLSNTPRLQAVCNAQGNVTQAAFYEPGALDTRNAQTITAEQPCLLMLNGDGATPSITVSDPTQKLPAPPRYKVGPK
ncbi:MAG: polysaccharide lyase 8 family protein [Candidatus Sumerlaeota bacterium]|nr:polysaccharide lyase 8 family protein [Candidatus Sumerlaeota bacterium]